MAWSTELCTPAFFSLGPIYFSSQDGVEVALATYREPCPLNGAPATLVLLGKGGCHVAVRSLLFVCLVEGTENLVRKRGREFIRRNSIHRAMWVSPETVEEGWLV